MRSCPQCLASCDSSHRFCPSCGFPVGEVARNDEDKLIGTTLPGGYVIHELIGIGGMGRVYRAEQTALGRTVAVKIIHPHLLGDENASARFIAEARTTSRLNHPNSVAVIDFGRTDSGQLYLVMEYLRGRDLARLMYEDGLLGFDRVVGVLRQVLAALSEAHHLGIIHRDLKPENIVVESVRNGGDFVKVVDFGLAKILSAKAPSITSDGIVCGTPDYMAPEQGRGDPIDGRSDLYTVGVILFQMLTNRLPFEADSPTQVVLKHITELPPDPRQIAPKRDIPASIVAVTMCALRKRAVDRYQTADEFSDALADAKQQFQTTLPASQPRLDAPSVCCQACGSRVPRGQKFCGDCGTRVVAPAPRISGEIQPPHAIPPPAKAGGARQLAQPSAHLFALAGRDKQLEWLANQYSSCTKSLAALRIVGDSGIGKTRVIDEFLSRCGQGDLQVKVGPDPWWADVGFYGLRVAIAELVGRSIVRSALGDLSDVPDDARLGLGVVFGKPEDVRDVTGPEHRRFCAAEALRWAMRYAFSGRGFDRTTVVLDDLQRIDGATANAFADVICSELQHPVLVIAAHVPTFEPEWPARFASLQLAGLDSGTAMSLLSVQPEIDALQQLQGRGVSPMHVEQLHWFMQEGGVQPPSRLGDLVALRIARLNASARRVLQAVAVLGDDTDRRHIQAIVEAGTEIDKVVIELARSGMITNADGKFRVAHPLIREIAEATIPLGARRELHAAAQSEMPDRPIPLEARAGHGYAAGDAFEALILLEQTGDLAASRDDQKGAVLSYRRGLEVARREIARGELDDPMHAVAVFGRKLGEALIKAGDLMDADGILREVLDLTPPTGEDRARVLLGFARLARARMKHADASRYLTDALDLARRAGASDTLKMIDETKRHWAS